MSKKNQKGFAALETVLIIVIIALVAFVAWYAFRVKNSANDTLDKAGNQQISPPQDKTKKPAASAEQTAVNVVTTKTDPKLGDYLADGNDKTLYTYNQDSANTSNCSGSCLALWPIYKAASSSAALPANVGTITRADGKIQYTYKKLPLYYYTGDTAAGQVTGDGVNGFSVAKP